MKNLKSYAKVTEQFKSESGPVMRRVKTAI